MIELWPDADESARSSGPKEFRIRHRQSGQRIESQNTIPRLQRLAHRNPGLLMAKRSVI